MPKTPSRRRVVTFLPSNSLIAGASQPSCERGLEMISQSSEGLRFIRWNSEPLLVTIRHQPALVVNGHCQTIKCASVKFACFTPNMASWWGAKQIASPAWQTAANTEAEKQCKWTASCLNNFEAFISIVFHDHVVEPPKTTRNFCEQCGSPKAIGKQLVGCHCHVR